VLHEGEGSLHERDWDDLGEDQDTDEKGDVKEDHEAQ
jgi:hypothetical protein